MEFGSVVLQVNTCKYMGSLTIQAKASSSQLTCSVLVSFVVWTRMTPATCLTHTTHVHARGCDYTQQLQLMWSSLVWRNV